MEEWHIYERETMPEGSKVWQRCIVYVSLSKDGLANIKNGRKMLKTAGWTDSAGGVFLIIGSKRAEDMRTQVVPDESEYTYLQLTEDDVELIEQHGFFIATTEDFDVYVFTADSPIGKRFSSGVQR